VQRKRGGHFGMAPKTRTGHEDTVPDSPRPERAWDDPNSHPKLLKSTLLRISTRNVVSAKAVLLLERPHLDDPMRDGARNARDLFDSFSQSGCFDDREPGKRQSG
jgi:hypothetical protein